VGQDYILRRVSNPLRKPIENRLQVENLPHFDLSVTGDGRGVTLAGES